MPPSSRAAKIDALCEAAVELAREAALEAAGVMGVGDHLGCRAEGERVVSHLFACPHPGYRGWQWSVTVARASRAKTVTVNEVVLLPGEGALLAASWLPWTDRIQPGDVTPGVLMPSPEEDPRLEPGYTGGEQAGDADPAEESLVRTVVAELGLGRERVLSFVGRQEAIERWLAGRGWPGQRDDPVGTRRLRNLRLLRPAASQPGRALRRMHQRLLTIRRLRRQHRPRMRCPLECGGARSERSCQVRCGKPSNGMSPPRSSIDPISRRLASSI